LRDWHVAVREAARQAAEREMAAGEGASLNYRWEHVQAVVTTALRLTDLVGADREIVEAAAWLHDVAKETQGEPGRGHHGQVGAEIARALLADTDFAPHKIEAVADAIAKHVGLVKEHLVEPLEAAVLWDADKLTKLGPVIVAHEALLAAQKPIDLQGTPDVGKWVFDRDLGARIAASMSLPLARRAAQARVLAMGDFTRQLERAWRAEDLVDPIHTGGYTVEAMRQDGRDGVLWSPLWRLRVELTPPERALLQTWPLRRLHFLHHNGASVFAYPLTVSRLQHTLGVLALVAHFAPDDVPLRVAALLHDVGHYPFCHSAELVPGVDHHAMTRRRVTGEPICGLLRAHGLDPEHLLVLMDGDPPNPLRTRNGLLHLDHLDSWARQAQAAGFAEMPAHELLACLSLEGNNVAADRATAEYLVRMIRQGNARHYAEGDIGPAAVLAHLLTLSLERGLITPDALADATDEALLARLAMSGDDEVSGLIVLLRREPWRVAVRRGDPGARPPAGALVVNLDGLYDAVPLLAGTGRPITEVSAAARDEMARVGELVGTFVVSF
jgi:putative nucleotidyltransferase with HDIG domain